MVSETFEDGVTERDVAVAVSEDLFLAPDTTFTISITRATLLGPQGAQFDFTDTQLNCKRRSYFAECMTSGFFSSVMYTIMYALGGGGSCVQGVVK